MHAIFNNTYHGLLTVFVTIISLLSIFLDVDLYDCGISIFTIYFEFNNWWIIHDYNTQCALWATVSRPVFSAFYIFDKTILFKTVY